MHVCVPRYSLNLSSQLVQQVTSLRVPRVMSIPVYRIANAKHDKIPKGSEIVDEQDIKANGFAYVRDLPEDKRNYTWYVVKEDDHVVLLGIQDLVVDKDGTKLYLPVTWSSDECCCRLCICIAISAC